MAVLPIRLLAQCNVLIGSASCSTTPPAPTYKTYIANQTTQLQTMINTTIGSTFTPLVITANFPEASSTFRVSDPLNCPSFNPVTCIYSTAVPGATSLGLNAVFDKGPGASKASVIILNLDPLPGMTAPQYVGSCTPPNPAFQAYQLSVDLALLTHIQSKGFQIWISFSPLQNSLVACGSTPGSITAAIYTADMNPTQQAYLAYMRANGVTISKVIGIHEVNGFNQITTQNVSAFSTSEWTTMLNSTCAAVHAVSGYATTPCGGGFTAGDNSWSSFYFTHATADCKEWFFETYGPYDTYSSAITPMMNLCATAISNGMTCDNSEGNPPVWGSATSEASAYAGCTWETGTNPNGFISDNEIYAWLYTMLHFISMKGGSSITWFGTEIMDLELTDPNPNCFASDSANSAYKVMTTANGPTSAVTVFNQVVTAYAMKLSGIPKTRGVLVR